jgi:26S proteasome regulatory subunit N10
VFVGSPVEVDEKELVAVAKKLKKNNVAVDVVNFGEDGENEEKLEKFVSTVCSKDGNRYWRIIG